MFNKRKITRIKNDIQKQEFKRNRGLLRSLGVPWLTLICGRDPNIALTLDEITAVLGKNNDYINLMPERFIDKFVYQVDTDKIYRFKLFKTPDEQVFYRIVKETPKNKSPKYNRKNYKY